MTTIFLLVWLLIVFHIYLDKCSQRNRIAKLRGEEWGLPYSYWEGAEKCEREILEKWGA